MTAKLTWASRVSLLRIGIAFLIVTVVYSDSQFGRGIASILVILNILLDSLDGYLARMLDEVTLLGSVLDIAADHIFQAAMWITLADLRMVPVWVPIVVISRDILTDSIRGYHLRFGFTALGEKTMMRTQFGKFLTCAPIMTASYSLSKAVSFSWLLLMSSKGAELDYLVTLLPFPIESGIQIGQLLALISVSLCILRGLPVIFEGLSNGR